MAALGVLHEQYGKQDWADLISPAADIAANGFEVSPRLAALVADNAGDLQASPNAAAYFFDEQGTPISAGTMLKNQDYADTLQKVAHEGPDAFYTGELAKAIVEEATRDTDNITPSQMTTADLAAYTPNVTEPLCGEYKEYEVCGMPPSSSGGIAVVETLRLLNDIDLAQYKPDSPGVDGALPAPEAIHLVSEAERLAYADRDAYVGDRPGSIACRRLHVPASRTHRPRRFCRKGRAGSARGTGWSGRRYRRTRHDTYQRDR